MADCYTLRNCENNLETITASSTIAYYLGTVVKVAGSDACWTVVDFTTCPEGYVPPDYTVTKECETCVQCLPLVEADIPRVFPEYFEDFAQTTETTNQIDINIKFANAYYQLFKTLKHGMEATCTNVDIDQITIKKKLCDLESLYDASVCTITTPVVVTPCVEPS